LFYVPTLNHFQSEDLKLRLNGVEKELSLTLESNSILKVQLQDLTISQGTEYGKLSSLFQEKCNEFVLLQQDFEEKSASLSQYENVIKSLKETVSEMETNFEADLVTCKESQKREADARKEIEDLVSASIKYEERLRLLDSEVITLQSNLDSANTSVQTVNKHLEAKEIELEIARNELLSIKEMLDNYVLKCRNCEMDNINSATLLW
jgi:uncharacterized protein YlxW (UPF0749 family)